MKRFYKIVRYIAVVVCTFGFINSSQAQDAKAEENSIKSLITSKNFVFKAQSASPTGGSLRQLTSEYDLRVSGDTVRSFLPYFGRAFSAPINPAQGGINFISTEFDYQFTERKKDRLEVLIRPKDAQDVRQMLLTVSKNGYASLQVLSNNRQPISFNGVVTEKGRR